MFEEALNQIKGILFPVFCAECGEEGKWWCEKCQKKAPAGAVFLCPNCGFWSDRGAVCPRCAVSRSLNGLGARFVYEEDGAVGRLIKDYKYHFASDIEKVWQAVLSPEFLLGCLGEEYSAIIPVPLHPRRERERGFNQAARIAKIVREKMEAAGRQIVLNENSLVRVRYTSQQARASKEEREENLSGAFAWQGEKGPPGHIVLVDDVFTTGATMRECARTLKAAGAKKVWGLVLARG